MLYMEALQTHTLEEQRAQLDALNADLADARQALSESQVIACFITLIAC